jgi:hypothetical protein
LLAGKYEKNAISNIFLTATITMSMKIFAQRIIEAVVDVILSHLV